MKMTTKSISLTDAAKELNVSSATILNWIRSGIILKNQNGISYSSVKSLKEKIISGTISKLNLRANKTFLNKNIYPKELLADKDIKPLNSQAADIFYQAGKSAGLKSKQGSFYTPDYIIDEIISDYIPSKGAKICDPCCGTGRFLKIMVSKFSNDVEFYGYDTDKEAIKIAFDELSRFKEKITVRYFDSLLNPQNEKFNFIFTNPPWGARYSEKYRNRLKEIYPEAGSGDSLEYFFIYAYRSIKKGGIISFILPESFLNVKRFRNIRKFLAADTTILKINSYGRVFSKVFSPVIRIDIKKSGPAKTHMIKAGNKNILQTHFINETDNVFNISITEQDRKIIDDIYSRPYITLKDHAEWSLGIVTGDNKRFVKNERTQEFNIEVITGKNIGQYSLKDGKKFISDDFSLYQQVAKNNLFSSKEKLVYKFISDRLVFAYDSTGVYTINSANVMVPDLKGYTIKSVMAILNSNIMKFVYLKKFGSLKVLRTNLEKLPFPENPDKKIINLIDGKTNCIINNDGCISQIRLEIEDLVKKLFGVKNESTISDPEKKIIPRT